MLDGAKDRRAHRRGGRSAWLALGFVLGALTLTLVGFLRRPEPPPSDPEAVSEGFESIEEPVPTCFLGVVLTKESLDVAAEIEGRVVEVLIHPGDSVASGQPLARLESEALRHQQEIERARLVLAETEARRDASEVEQAERRYQRRVALGDLVSPEDVESAKLELEAAQYRLEVARAALREARARHDQLAANLERTVVRAPFSGVVALRYLETGGRVTPGSPVAKLISSEASRVRFAVPSVDAASLIAGQEVRVEIESSGQAVPATIEHLSPEIDSVTGMVLVEARLGVDVDSAHRIPAGAVARVSSWRDGEPSASCIFS